ncbi:helix-turn-helix domain-containing protein [Celerinatantimonas sp. YJH-8]|uniref:helix-turn-helix domain-containing protein n=1 Tax=Celerinatantimonas sp. YJH-8 TaxID=3228714 RepID=UPI0038CA9903
MPNTLSIRSYSRQHFGHTHDYEQLVLPIQGAINIQLDGYSGKVSLGECLIIRAGKLHHFDADEQARFIVADMEQLPETLQPHHSPLFSLSPPLLSFLFFVEKQLQHQLDSNLEVSINAMFYQLLARQNQHDLADPRIREVQSYLSDHLAEELTIKQLAQIAFLSPTQFKKRFKQALGNSVFQYLTQLRMEKAKALLIHTDLPIQQIAEQVGYQDQSAFSRRFTNYTGLSPRAFSHG